MKLKTIARSLIVAGIVTPVMAQNTSEQRVEITGSSIKRIQSEGALPLQIIRFEDIAKAGITSAEQLVQALASNGTGVDNMISNQGGDFLNSLINSGRGANNGSSAANLRGLGAQNTLVLLNGRRVSPHGLNGTSVDLNSIPFAAIDRIEILKDGASAIYGTDAIGGVMNFILKKNYTGLEIGSTLDVTEGGGGNLYNGALTFGAGSLDAGGFNFIASLGYSKQERLRGNQRDFHNGYQPLRGLAMDTTGTPFANIGAAAGTALPAGYRIAGNSTTQNRVNLLALQGKCESITGQVPYRGDITGFNNAAQACSYDYGRDWSLQQPVERLNLVSRGMLKLGTDHTAIVEFTGSRVTSDVQYTPNQLTTAARGANYPVFQQDINGVVVKDAAGKSVKSPYYLDLTGQVPGYDNTKPIRIRWRCVDCGYREQSTESNTYRALLGLEGVLAGKWDYRIGLSSAGAKAETQYLDGYFIETKLKSVMETGLVNPFLQAGQKQTQAALDLLDSAKYRGPLYGGEVKLNQIDGVISGELFKLPAGALSAAVGIDLRKESFKFNDNTVGIPALIGAGSPATLPKASRDVKAVFAELNVPIVKDLEAQLAVRHDKYSDFGSTTNPKVALRWQPAKELLFRGSYNTGFHAPDFGPLYAGESRGQFNSDVDDPEFCPKNPGNINFCKIRPLTRSGSNPDLQPEKSKQYSIGFVVAPNDMFSASIDVFNVEISDRIGVQTPNYILANYLTLGNLIVRDPVTNIIDYVRAGYINVGGDKVRGADLNVTLNFKTELGRITAKIDGTYLDQYLTRLGPSEPWSQRVGAFGDSSYLWDLKLRWKHNASMTWTQGAWSATLSQDYKSGYREEVDGFGSGVILQDKGFQSKVAAYSLYNASVTYTGIKSLTVTAGVKNLLDRDPPFSLHNIDNIAGAGWDARVGDPRGRAYTLRLNYKFW